MLKRNIFLMSMSLSLMICLEASSSTNVYCGYSEKTDFPKLNIVIKNIDPNCHQLVFNTTKGDKVFVLVSLTDSIYDNNKKDLSLLVLNSTAGGYYQATSTGIIASENKSSGVHLQLPLPRLDGGLYFVKVMCAI